jgi:hypothetical protein
MSDSDPTKRSEADDDITYERESAGDIKEQISAHGRPAYKLERRWCKSSKVSLTQFSSRPTAFRASVRCAIRVGIIVLAVERAEPVPIAQNLGAIASGTTHRVRDRAVIISTVPR